MTSLELARKAATFLDSKKAEKLNVIEVDSISSLADYFVIATGNNNTHVRALADELDERMKAEGLPPARMEGYRSNSWILLDWGSVVVHIFTQEGRDFYDLDRLWADGNKLDCLLYTSISRYRYRKEESERRLAKAEDNLVRLRDILTELEDRVEPLRIQAEKAQQFIAFDQEKKGLEIGIWLTTLDRSGAVLREHGEKMALAQAQHNELEEEIQSIAQRTEENYRQTNQCTVEMEEARNQAAALDGEAVRAQGCLLYTSGCSRWLCG